MMFSTGYSPEPSANKSRGSKSHSGLCLRKNASKKSYYTYKKESPSNMKLDSSGCGREPYTLASAEKDSRFSCRVVLERQPLAVANGPRAAVACVGKGALGSSSQLEEKLSLCHVSPYGSDECVSVAGRSGSSHDSDCLFPFSTSPSSSSQKNSVGGTASSMVRERRTRRKETLRGVIDLTREEVDPVFSTPPPSPKFSAIASSSSPEASAVLRPSSPESEAPSIAPPPSSPKSTAMREDCKTQHVRTLSEKKRKKILRKGDIFKGVRSVKDISDIQLRRWLYVKKPLMVALLKGEEFSWRHENFLSGCRKRGALMHQMDSHHFKKEHVEVIVDTWLHVFCGKDMKHFGYVMSVLLAECLVRIISDVHKVSFHEAEQLMMDYSGITV